MSRLPRQPNLRADAAWVLYQILEQGQSSRECLASVQQRHSAKDNGWLQEMTMGALRQVPQLQLWLRQLLDTPLKGSNKIVEHLLMLGFYQLAFTRVSAHAAVAETVNAVPMLASQRLKGLANAILRNFQRQQLDQHLSDNPIVQSGLPKWLYKGLAEHYSDALPELLTQTNKIAPLWLRVNTSKVSRKAYLTHLQSAGVDFTLSDAHSDAVVLTGRHEVTGLPGFAEGWFAVQDGAAQLAAAYLDAQPDERILDCCAAPGGKTGHLLERQPALAHCLALDFDARRLDRVRENMQRLGHAPAIAQGDAATPDAWWDGQLFDRILLDAPCSATGVIRRHPDIRWLRKKSDIAQLVELQQAILQALWPLLKPGGTLLYATCSILPDENRLQMQRFLQHQPDASLVPLHSGDTAQHPGRQILPGEQQMDGFYYCRLLKSEK